MFEIIKGQFCILLCVICETVFFFGENVRLYGLEVIHLIMRENTRFCPITNILVAYLNDMGFKALSREFQLL